VRNGSLPSQKDTTMPKHKEENMVHKNKYIFLKAAFLSVTVGTGRRNNIFGVNKSCALKNNCI
jgi:hypothetical protein